MGTKNQSTRRKFLAGAASTALGLTYIPSSVFARPAPSDRLNLGHIGIGGRGRRFLRPLAQLDEKVVPWEDRPIAFCGRHSRPHSATLTQVASTWPRRRSGESRASTRIFAGY